MSCPDREGIVAIATRFIKKHDGNILQLSQYVDNVEGMFFMRIVWDMSKFSIPKTEIKDTIEAEFVRYGVNFNLYFDDERPRMAIFVSKMSHCLYDLLARYTEGEWNVELPLIISNHPDLEIAAKRFDIPYFHIPITKDNKDEQEQFTLNLLKEHNIDFIVLARYMQILTPTFINSYPDNIINIHHSFLPAFVGAKPYHAAHARGVKIIGATSHYVTSEIDAGPIIDQGTTRISHKDSVEMLVRKGRDLEKIILSNAVGLHIEHKILSHNNKTIIFS